MSEAHAGEEPVLAHGCAVKPHTTKIVVIAQGAARAAHDAQTPPRTVEQSD
jgi:hypothetical protein